MKNKLIGIFVCTMLIVTAILPVSGNVNMDKTELEEQHLVDGQETATTTGDEVDWWPQFQHDSEHRFGSTGKQGMDSICWRSWGDPYRRRSNGGGSVASISLLP